MDTQNLSARELQVMNKIIDGEANKKISAQLSITERTVKFHCGNIYKKMNVSNKFELLKKIAGK